MALIHRGVPAFLPHLTCFLAEAPSVAYDRWMAYDLLVIERCTHLLMVGPWQESNGALMELEHARRLGLHISFSLEDLERALGLPPAPAAAQESR